MQRLFAVLRMFAASGVVATSGNELLAALGAAPGKHFAPILGRHAGTEPVGPLATNFAGLICAFHVDALTIDFASKKGRKGTFGRPEVSIQILR